MKYIPLVNLKNTTGIVAFCKEAKEIVVANRNGIKEFIDPFTGSKKTKA